MPRSRSLPWWEDCSSLGHSTKAPCVFCIDANVRAERLSKLRVTVLSGVDPWPAEMKFANLTPSWSSYIHWDFPFLPAKDKADSLSFISAEFDKMESEFKYQKHKAALLKLFLSETPVKVYPSPHKKPSEIRRILPLSSRTFAALNADLNTKLAEISSSHPRLRPPAETKRRPRFLIARDFATAKKYLNTVHPDSLPIHIITDFDQLRGVERGAELLIHPTFSGHPKWPALFALAQSQDMQMTLLPPWV